MHEIRDFFGFVSIYPLPLQEYLTLEIARLLF